MLRADAVIIDEVGFDPIDDNQAQLLFRFVVAAAYQRELLTGPGRQSRADGSPLKARSSQVIGHARYHRSTAQQRHGAVRWDLTVRSC